MCGSAAKILVSERQQRVLGKVVAATCSPRRLITRARVILFAFDGLSNIEIGQHVKLGRGQIGVRRRRWRDSFEALVSIECGESHGPRLCE